MAGHYGVPSFDIRGLRFDRDSGLGTRTKGWPLYYWPLYYQPVLQDLGRHDRELRPDGVT